MKDPEHQARSTRLSPKVPQYSCHTSQTGIQMQGPHQRMRKLKYLFQMPLSHAWQKADNQGIPSACKRL